MGLGDILQEAVGSGTLLRAIESGFKQDRPKPPLNSDSYLRASAIPGLCAREEVICANDDVMRRDSVDPGLNLTFLHGTALHWAVQNKLLGPLGSLYGTWRCDKCGHLHGDSATAASPADFSWAVPMPKKCAVPDCGGHELTYVEPAFVDHDLRLTGHTDGLLVLPGLPGMGILEVKSIGERGFREVQNVPQIGHMVQAHIYMMFTGFRWAKILYWHKGGNGLPSLKEHHVERDEETIRRIQDVVRSVWAGIALKSLPQRICANSVCPRAKLCSVAEKCFANE